MELLYTAQTQFTWEECWQMTKTATLRRPHLAGAVVALLLLCVLLSSVVGSALPLFLALVFFVAYAIILRIGTRRAFLANRIMRDQNMSFYFYADHFEADYSGGHTCIPFDQLFAIWETPTNFYLMLSPNQGYVLNRTGCNEALIDFLRLQDPKKKKKKR